eukprot:TRINITY_DN111228_c0_g1_i1.p1 TRINITY_DN111228_c0_g1~~TRINITY_DN111228_c0_g1_i1.p1  ORF type:complete len:233 (+),score=40.85 TRINITY_DN111228_c0_g1_i1:48-746(+)
MAAAPAQCTSTSLPLPLGTRHQQSCDDQPTPQCGEATPEAWAGASPAARQFAGCQSPSDHFFNPSGAASGSAFMSPMSAYFEGAAVPSFFDTGGGVGAPVTQPEKQTQQPAQEQSRQSTGQQAVLQGMAGFVPWPGPPQAGSLPAGMAWAAYPGSSPQPMPLSSPFPVTLAGPTLLQSVPEHKQQTQPQAAQQPSRKTAPSQQPQQRQSKKQESRAPCPAAIYVDLSSLREK